MEDILVLFNKRVNNIKREYASKYIYFFERKVEVYIANGIKVIAVHKTNGHAEKT